MVVFRCFSVLVSLARVLWAVVHGESSLAGETDREGESSSDEWWRMEDRVSGARRGGRDERRGGVSALVLSRSVVERQRKAHGVCACARALKKGVKRPRPGVRRSLVSTRRRGGD